MKVVQFQPISCRIFKLLYTIIMSELVVYVYLWRKVSFSLPRMKFNAYCKAEYSFLNWAFLIGKTSHLSQIMFLYKNILKVLLLYPLKSTKYNN